MASNSPLDHPSYLTRQLLDFLSTAGNGTISNGQQYPYAIRVRKMAANVVTAGTSTGYGIALLAIGTCTQSMGGTPAVSTATATLGSITLTTNTANTPAIAMSADMNTLVNQGCVLALKNLGTDATGVCTVNVEWYHDPVSSTWTVGN